MDDEKFSMIEKHAPKLLKLMGFGDAERALLSTAIVGVVKRVKDIEARTKVAEARAARAEALHVAIAEKVGVDVAAVLGVADAS